MKGVQGRRKQEAETEHRKKEEEVRDRRRVRAQPLSPLTGRWTGISIAISSHISIMNTDISIRTTARKEAES